MWYRFIFKVLAREWKEFFFLIEVMIYNVVLVSGVQQSDLVIQMNICIFHILFHYGLFIGH